MGAYEDIHGNESNPIKVGVDLSSVAAASLAASSPQPGVTSGGADKFEQQVAIMPSFKVYWDDQSGKYKVNDPIVIGPDGEITVQLPDEITAGTWYCKICNEDGTWNAVVVDDNTDDENSPKYIPIFTIDNANNVVQHHVGSIVLGKGGVTSLKGDDEDSEKVDGDVEIDGGKSGLTVKTELEEQDGDDPPKAKVTIDVKGRESASGCDNTENWGCQEVKLPGGGLAHVLGCHPIDLSNVLTKGGGGGGDDPDESGSDSDDPSGGDKIKGTKYVRTITGEGHNSDPLSGDLQIEGEEGSGLEVTTEGAREPTEDDPNPNGTIRVDLAGRKQLQNCSKQFGIHQLKYKDNDGNTQIYHVLSCGDIDLTKEGKLIKNTSVHISASPGGQNTIVFTYTDGSQDTFSIANGLNGSPGSPGRDGDTPEITSERQGSHIYIYADGDLIADIEDGHTPEITADKQGKVTTIYVDGNAVATINDGEDSEDDDELQEMDMVTGVTFELSGGKLIAKVAKKKVKAKLVSDLGTSNVDVCECKEVEVVTSESYSTTSHKFTNTRRKITVLKDVAGTNQTPFTATPLSSE